MSLPILNITAAPTVETLIRYYHQTETKWTEHLASSEQLDFGTAWSNPQLPRIYDANRILDVALPPGMSAQQALDQVAAHYSERGTTCSHWVMNPSAPESQTAPMIELLLSKGYQRAPADIMYLQRLPTSPIGGSSEELQIIPSRASFKHAQSLFEEEAHALAEPQLAEAAMLHLDDPHYDALLAIRDGQGLAHAGVLAVGEIGRIDQVFVTESMRNRRIGTTMMSRALEICARSLFKHVLVGVLPGNAVAVRLYEDFGFKKIGEFVGYFAPGVNPPRKA